MSGDMDIRVRRARPTDWTAALRASEGVWEGHDYVPLVWRQWLTDSRGILQAAVVRGEAVGFQHVYAQRDGSAWMEGIRVASGARRHGVGEALARAAVAWAREMGCPAARLTVSSDNPGSRRLAERMGFAAVAEFVTLSAPPAEQSDPTARLWPAQAQDAEAVQMVLGQWYAAGYYTRGWTAYRLTPDEVRLLTATYGVLVADHESIDGVAIATHCGDASGIQLGLIAGSQEAVRSLGSGLRARAAALGLPGVTATIAATDDITRALHGAGFEGTRDHTVLLMEQLWN
jgi:RimJ/RimL family protein N-acetyltransferase